ncbi:hypothetical protein [Vibrio campbellii]|uniref:hypothetical protein n=1 Tax=Vibrio campbellii TaxID=680 RepID=UPI001F293829|nr:hypothetical protein [Vibrio campbellii]MCE7729610.1 hypothetical protein [Vibrio campbellii]
MHQLIQENHAPLVQAVLSTIENTCPNQKAFQAALCLLSSHFKVSEVHTQFVVTQLSVLGLIQKREGYWLLTFEGRDLLSKIAATAL